MTFPTCPRAELFGRGGTLLSTGFEAGYDPAFVQTQAGHAHASITGVYTSVGDDFKQKTIQKMIARRIARPEEANPHG
jgi:integrase